MSIPRCRACCLARYRPSVALTSTQGPCSSSSSGPPFTLPKFCKGVAARRAADQQDCFTENLNHLIMTMALFRLSDQTVPRASQRKRHHALNAPVPSQEENPPLYYCMGKPSSMNNVRSFVAIHVCIDHIESIIECTIMKTGFEMT